MSNMIERAARAICREHGVDPDHVNADPRSHAIPRQDGVMSIVSDHRGPIWTMWTDDARAALLAALDPEDGDLEIILARAIRHFASDPDVADDVARARAAIKALRAHAQGGPSDAG